MKIVEILQGYCHKDIFGAPTEKYLIQYSNIAAGIHSKSIFPTFPSTLAMAPFSQIRNQLMNNDHAWLSCIFFIKHSIQHYKLYSDLFVTLFKTPSINAQCRSMPLKSLATNDWIWNENNLFWRQSISHRLAPVSRPLLKLLQISQNTICSAREKHFIPVS